MPASPRTSSFLERIPKTSSQFVTPSEEIEIHLPDERTLRGPRGATAESLLQPMVEGLRRWWAWWSTETCKN